MIYFSSDLHFSHDRSFIYALRGFSTVNEMNETIINRFNSILTDEDDLYILGDLCLGGAGEDILQKNKTLIERINGKLHIIFGNHCSQQRQNMYANCQNVVEICGWAQTLNYKGYHFYLSHFPSITSNLEKESLKQCTCCLFGHTHQQTNFYYNIPFIYHVGVDSHNCYPVSIERIIYEMKEKVNECKELI